MDTFALVMTAGPQPRPARSTPGEPGRAADRQAFASLSCPTHRQVLRNPHVGRSARSQHNIVYDNVTQCFGHNPLSEAMRLFGKTDLRLCRKQSPWHGRSAAPVPSWDRIPYLVVCRMLNDTIGIVSHDSTLAQLCCRLAALALKMRPTSWHQRKPGPFACQEKRGPELHRAFLLPMCSLIKCIPDRPMHAGVIVMALRRVASRDIKNL